MIDKLRARPLLDGYRGAPPGDRAALIDVIRRVSALVEVVPELRELDLNPVKVLRARRGRRGRRRPHAAHARHASCFVKRQEGPMTARDLMTTPVHTCHAYDTLGAAIQGTVCGTPTSAAPSPSSTTRATWSGC